MPSKLDSLVDSVTMIIPTRNRQLTLQNTMQSLYKVKNFCHKQGVCVDILVVDDASEDPIGPFRDANIIRSDIHLGESAAVNLGWKHTNSRFVAIVSDDDPQPEKWLSELRLIAKLNPGYVVYYPSTLEIYSNGKTKRFHKAYRYNKKRFQSLMRSPVLAGALIDRSLLTGRVRESPRLEITFPSDLIQWLRFSTQAPFFACPTVVSQWVRNSFQGSNRFTSTTASEELVIAMKKWTELESVPLCILLGAVGRIIQFNAKSLAFTIKHTNEIWRMILREYNIRQISLEITKTLPLAIYQLFIRNFRET